MNLAETDRVIINKADVNNAGAGINLDGRSSAVIVKNCVIDSANTGFFECINVNVSCSEEDRSRATIINNVHYGPFGACTISGNFPGGYSDCQNRAVYFSCDSFGSRFFPGINIQPGHGDSCLMVHYISTPRV